MKNIVYIDAQNVHKSTQDIGWMLTGKNSMNTCRESSSHLK